MDGLLDYVLTRLLDLYGLYMSLSGLQGTLFPLRRFFPLGFPSKRF